MKWDVSSVSEGAGGRQRRFTGGCSCRDIEWLQLEMIFLSAKSTGGESQGTLTDRYFERGGKWCCLRHILFFCEMNARSQIPCPKYMDKCYIFLTPRKKRKENKRKTKKKKGKKEREKKKRVHKLLLPWRLPIHPVYKFSSKQTGAQLVLQSWGPVFPAEQSLILVLFSFILLC